MCVCVCMCVCVYKYMVCFKPIDLLYQVVYNIYYIYIYYIFKTYVYGCFPTYMHELCVPGGCVDQKRNHCL